MRYRLEVRMGDFTLIREVDEVPNGPSAINNHADALKFLLAQWEYTAPTRGRTEDD